MVSVPLDTRPHMVAIKALVDAKISPWHLYSYGEVPGDKNHPDAAERKKPLPDLYALLTVERRYLAANRRTAARASRSSWTATVRSVGRSVDEAAWLEARVALALNEVRLSIAGRFTTRLQHESSNSAEPDDGRFSGLVIYTYTH